MKLRHGPAIALVGWYLMAPPPFSKAASPADLDASAPLSHWRLVESYDTARECNAEKDHMMDAGETPWLREVGQSGLCIASDDPRLAK
jgi:hypothetical protein